MHFADPDTLFYWIGNKLLKEGSTDLSCPKCSWTWDPDEFVEDCKMSFDERIFFQEVLNVNMLKKAFAQVEDLKKAKILQLNHCRLRVRKYEIENFFSTPSLILINFIPMRRTLAI